MRLISLIVMVWLVLYSANSRAEGWSTKDTKLGVAALVVTVVDWGQTLNIVDRPGYFEHNLMLGRHPTRAEVNQHFLLTTLLVGSLAHFIPKYRTEILAVYVTVQTINTVRNYSIGLKVSF